jgi:hypothetical protein
MDGLAKEIKIALMLSNVISSINENPLRNTEGDFMSIS